MNDQHWRQVDEIFQAAIELSPDRRLTFLDQACSGDEGLRRQVEAMLDADDRGWDLMETPALEAAAPLLADETPELSTGDRIGRFEIVRLIGRGGMGEVYLARDETLKRQVALKLLPADYTKHKNRVLRFQQEAQAASGLNHPNILTIHEIGQIQGQHFIATEFIDGETLRERLNRSHLNLDEALDFAIQVGSALSAAHQAGIVHRDIKPENIMIRPDGYVKLLDFGLAKLTEVATEPSVSHHSTPGLVMGTIKYVSPEQARGVDIDQRSDIFSFGVVLYEMLTNHAPFEGETSSDLIAAILTTDPPLLADYENSTPERLQEIVNKALRKDKEARYQTVSEIIDELKSLRASTRAQTQPNFGRRDTNPTRAELSGRFQLARPVFSAQFVVSEIKRHKFGAATTLLIFLSISTASIGYLTYRLTHRPQVASTQNIRVARVTTSGKAANSAISPDAKYVAYISVDDGQQSLWIRQIPTSTNIQIVSPQPVAYWGLTFSPDNNYLYFWGSSKEDSEPSLYQMPSLGGVKRKLITGVQNTNTPNNTITFSPDGSQLTFVREYASGETAVVIYNADGTGERELARRKGSEFFVAAAWSPKGDRIGSVIGSADNKGRYSSVVEINLRDGSERVITAERWRWISDIVWASAGDSLLVTASKDEGDPIQIWELSNATGNARRITTDLNSYSGLSLTADSSALATTLNDKLMNIWTQPATKGEAATQITFGTATKDGWNGIAWTPDNRIVYSSNANASQDIWIMNADGSNQRQLTSGLGSDRFGLAVSPDGRYVCFVSNRGGKSHIWRTTIDGASFKQLTNANGESDPFFWPDGQWVGYHESSVWKVPVEGGPPAQISSQFSEMLNVSPDGKLIAYLLDDNQSKKKRIGIAPAEGGTPIKDFDLPPTPPRRIQWTPDGRSFTYSLNRGRVANIWSQPLDGSKPEQLTDFKTHFIQSFAWSRDGKQLALARWSVTSDIVLIRDFR